MPIIALTWRLAPTLTGWAYVANHKSLLFVKKAFLLLEDEVIFVFMHILDGTENPRFYNDLKIHMQYKNHFQLAYCF